MSEWISVEDRLLSSIKKKNGCWEWKKSLNNGGYGRLMTGSRKNNTRKTKSAHRVSFETFIKKIPKNLWVLHKCDNRKCINPKHLFLGTRQDNIDDRESKGRNKPINGELNPNCKHTLKQIKQIKILYAKGKTMRDIAFIYGYKGHKTVFDIIHGNKWNLPEPPK